MPLLKRTEARNQTGPGGEGGLVAEQASAPASSGAGTPPFAFAAKKGILRTCANPHCASGWLHLWRSRETPVFEDGWCCSPECTLARVEAALRREVDAQGVSRASHRHRIPLGLAMLEQGWITQNDLRAALAAQRSAGCGKLGEWLVRQGSTNEDRVTRTLGLQWGCPVLSIDFHTPSVLTAFLPRLFVDAFGALPLRLAAGKILYLGFDDHVDPALALAIERMTGLRVEAGLVESSRFRPAHAHALEQRFPSAGLIEAATEQALAQALAKAIEESRPVEARLVRVHDCFWLRLWRRPQTGSWPDPGSIRDLIASMTGH
jgi:hypothetical protein